MSENDRQIALIHRLLPEAEALGLPLWLESGWAVDARLGRVTREHEDVDLAVPAEHMARFQALLRAHGASGFEVTDYGFLVRLDGVLLDCEPCLPVAGAYELDGVPPGACPMEPEGVIDGLRVRCTSWQAILWEYFFYLQEVPHEQWPLKDRRSYQAVRAAVGTACADAWHASFLQARPGAGRS